ncbi:MAG: PTS sugar transporter subunit IIA [Arenicellales bacterium]
MTGIILLTYGRIGYELLEAAAHIMNQPVEQIKVINVYDDPDTPDNLPGQIENAIEQLKSAEQCLIVTDLRGCTHFNVARQFVEPSRVSLVSGLNLPMLLRLLYHRDEKNLVTLSHFAEEGGVMGISTTSDAPAEGGRFL